jgi:Leucine-rich repeat (LRR) protein
MKDLDQLEKNEKDIINGILLLLEKIYNNRSPISNPTHQLFKKYYPNWQNNFSISKHFKFSIRNGHVESVQFIKLGLGYLPEEVVKLKFLKELIIDSCSIEKLPEDLGRLKSLENLTIRSTALMPHPIPNSIGNLKSLKELYLSIRITSLPESIGKLKKLKKIILSSWKLNSLPENPFLSTTGTDMRFTVLEYNLSSWYL